MSLNLVPYSPGQWGGVQERGFSGRVCQETPIAVENIQGAWRNAHSLEAARRNKRLYILASVVFLAIEL